MRKSASVFLADSLLLLTAAIWGFAFVAQRVGMDSLGPFAFNAVRYALGSLVLLPLIWWRRKTEAAKDRGAIAARVETQIVAPAGAPAGTRSIPAAPFRSLAPSIIVGSVMFIAASFQQVGIVSTTAGNAAFVTSLYVVIVPLIGSLFGRKTGAKDYLAALIAVAGLYIITVGSGFHMEGGDLLVLAGSLFWAIHILVIGHFASRVDPVALSAGQFAVCGFYSLIAALILEPSPFAGVLDAAVPILYGGIFSCGVAFTLQIVAQRSSPPAHVSILLAMEGLFGAIGGVIILGEPASLRLLSGGVLMLGAALLSQVTMGKQDGKGRMKK
jgi:drug/metabolite transporter (DMT)-like permease